MTKSCFLAATLVLGLIGTGQAIASSSQWFDSDGARIRLVTTGEVGPDGLLTGALQVELKPGWKTYWRDPGDAGVPPSADISASTNIESASLDFPAPQRHDEGDYKWAGYDYPVAFPVTFKLQDAGKPALVEADVFLGVCQSICIPVSAKLSVDPASDPENGMDAAVVSAAVEALPDPERADAGVRVVSEPGDDTVTLEAFFPGDPAKADLFIAGEDGYAFTTPVKSMKDGKTLFTTQVSLPARQGTGPGIYYTLVTEGGAVSGLLPYF